MKQEVVSHTQHEVDESFVQIIERTYGADAPRQLIGQAAVRQALPFGSQFMHDLPDNPTDPRATTPGGQTVTTDNGTASLDDPSSNDVL